MCCCLLVVCFCVSGVLCVSAVCVSAVLFCVSAVLCISVVLCVRGVFL